MSLRLYRFIVEPLRKDPDGSDQFDEVLGTEVLTDSEEKAKRASELLAEDYFGMEFKELYAKIELDEELEPAMPGQGFTVFNKEKYLQMGVVV